MKKHITLYPSNWLYNAAVIGFLKVLAWKDFLGEKEVEKLLREDGTVDIPGSVFDEVDISGIRLPESLKKYADYFSRGQYFEKWRSGEDGKGVSYRDKYKEFTEKLGDFGLKYIYMGRRLFSINCAYQGLVQAGEWDRFQYSRLISEKLKKYDSAETDKSCEFCSELKAEIPEAGNDLEERLFRFASPHMENLGPAFTGFPNSFWNNRTSLALCPLCSYLLIHSHLPFIWTSSGNIFINAMSFRSMWYLNKYSESAFSYTNARELLAMGMMSLSQKINKTLGLWSSFNIEIVVKTRDGIKYNSLDSDTAKLLLNKNISSLIQKSKEPLILNLILGGKYDLLMKLSTKLIRSAFSGKADGNDAFIKQLKNKNNIQHLKMLSQLLPQLYIKIDALLKTREFYE